MRRRGTGESGDDRSLRRRNTRPYSAQGDEAPRLQQDRYGVYNGMTWAKLKGYLDAKFPKSKYPGLEFKEQRLGDYWVFEVPELLTTDDKKELEKLRDKSQTRHPSQSPEPE
ncbi:hypothetical protein A1O1_08592 [Capronia coronata CBS 617.96]|uniref:Uncharacterized protein n=1 Tax=Capronia coronata CBS 617.96 TaxID=1182541 RepID=W9XIX1_9EURO|nr:uncharacterized protein A1O1_08592 [Capronia coronata CBS 617.96]EXJ80447.1 hypothetical protein A1O1_08592 [Capronia coronata CBS 617.96]